MSQPAGKRPVAAILAALSVTAAGCQSTPSRAPVGGPVVDPAAYVGRAEGELVGALGQPDSARTELDAHVWQYGGTSCVVDFYLYPEGSARTVAYAEARDRTSGAPLSSCALGAG